MTNYSIESRMSENEKLDDQLRNGTDYVNLPQHLFPTDRAPTWIPQQGTTVVSSESKSPNEIRYRPATTINQIRSHHYANQQQIDAQNRLQQLELIRPKENLDLLNVKFRHVQHPRHSRPILPQYRDDYVNTLYDQTGSFVHERAGLYHTETYEPSALAQAIPELTNQNEDSSLTTEKTQSKLFQTRALGDYQHMRNQLLKKLGTPNDSGTVNVRTQEGNTQLVQTQTIYGQSFNTPKFLQENRLAFHARTDPTQLMSTRFNGNLNRVRSMNSYPLESTENIFPITNSNQPLVSPVLRPSGTDEIFSTNSIGEHTNGYIRRPTVRVYDSPFQKSINLNRSQSFKQESKSFDSNLSIPKQIPRSVKTVISLPGQEIVAKLIEPTFAPRTTYQHAFKDVVYQELPVQASKKIENIRQQSTDNRPRQSQLRDIQERWSKTQALKEYHLEYPEPIPDVGGNTIRAKKEILLADEFAKRAALIIR